jgi:hypothetical protein
MTELLLDPQDPRFERASFLVAIRAFANGEAGATIANLREPLAFVLPHESASHLKEAVQSIVETETEAGRFEAIGKRTRLSPAAQAHTLEQLGCPQLTAPVKWTQLRDCELMAHALGLPAPTGEQRRLIKSAPGLRAAVLTRIHGLPLPPYPTLARARDALAWQQLEHLTERAFSSRSQGKFGSGPVLEALLGSILDRDLRMTPTQLVTQLAAAAVGSRASDPAGLRRAILSRWFEGKSAAKSQPATTSQPAAAGQPAPAGQASDDLESFAERILQLARHCKPGPVGDDLIFIADVWRALPQAERPELSIFKSRLLRAMQRELLSLVRADLVAAMDLRQVEESETHHLGAQFHFIRLTPEAAR